ncbi:leucine-rich repeat domain-containing protein [Puia sp. P3]|uniref:leucine-rich repeat domain-containing protein n=1 Tax=Puia sp. P3 TaxID=3423952 RepID=UPI003D674E3E
MQAPDSQAGLRLADQLIAAAKADGANFIDLGNLGLNAIPSSLLMLKDQLSGISFGSAYVDANGVERSNSYKFGKNWISSFEMLSEFPLLNSLSLAEMEISGVAQIGPLQNLKTLDLRGGGGISLDGLPLLGALTWLSLQDRSINSLNALYFLQSLRTINLKGTTGADLGIFTKAPFAHLTSLNLSNVPRTGADLHCLSGLTSLERLYLGSCGLKDIDGLATLKNLKTLSLRYNKIGDLRSLTELTALEELHLSGNRITTISPIANLRQLTDLSLRRNQVSDISALAGCTRLEKLRLNQNQIQDASPLSNITTLKRLAIKQNPLRSLSFLTKLKSLIYIGLSETGIEDLTPLAGLTHLRRLNISGNPVKDLTPSATGSGPTATK